MGRPIAQANIQLELPEFDPKNLPEWAEEFAEFLLLTGQSHVDVATKCSLLKRSCKKKFLQKQVKQIVKTCSTWAEVLQRLEKTFPVYETDLGVRTQIEELPIQAGSDPRGHLGVTWGVYLCAGKPPLADIILSHPPDLTRCDSVIGLAIPAMSGHIQYRSAAS